MGKITCYVDGVPRQIEVDLNYIHQPKLKLLRIALRYVCMRVSVSACARVCVCVSVCVPLCMRVCLCVCVGMPLCVHIFECM